MTVIAKFIAVVLITAYSIFFISTQNDKVGVSGCTELAV
jgi:hypothetical protein